MDVNIQGLKKEITELEHYKNILKSEIIELDDKILFQEFGVYHPQYNFANLDNYKDKLTEIRNLQKEMIGQGRAACCLTQWRVEGSENIGKKMINENIKQIIRNFNIECDLIINKVKFSNYQKSKERIFKSFELNNNLNETKNIIISDNYYKLKIKELDLAYEYQQKKEEEKERVRLKREERKEAERVSKELEEKRKELDKEREHYTNYIKKIDQQISNEQSVERKKYLIDKRAELNNNITDVDLALKDLDYREANQRAGWVYVISNIGAFGKNVYKIGMTRRLYPEERIAELSGASVPFKFDIHALIFSEDAPKLETVLHNKFAHKKLNLINGRKEFFCVSLDEIKEVILNNYDKAVDFVDEPDAEQFRESEMLRKNNEYKL